MRRIAFVKPMHFGPSGYIGGGERYPLNLARGLVAAAPDVHLDLIASGPVARVESLHPRLDVHVLPTTLPNAGEFDAVSASMVELLERVDLVHVHQVHTLGSQVAMVIAKALGLPLVASDHGAVTNRNNEIVGHVELADLVMFYSRFGSTMLPTARPSCVIPGGVDSRFFRPAPEPLERSHVLFAGRLLRHKGIDRLIAALPAGLPLKVVGRPYDPGFAAYLGALSAGRDVEVLTGIDDLELRDLYRRAHATVLPSVHRDAWGGTYEQPELMGLTALESMACGTPAVVSTAGALPEFVRDEETGYVFADLPQLRERLSGLADRTVDTDAMGARARAVVEEHWGLDVVGAKLLAAYEEVWAACAS